MTIQGGGGGRKIPPGGGPPRLPSTEKAPTSSPPLPASSPTSFPPGTRARDAFDAGRPIDPRLATERAGLPPMTEVTTTSGIESMIRLLEDRRAQILEEHKALRAAAQRIVAELARHGFDRGALDQRRAELAELRQRLAQQRRRLQQIQRRLKTALQRSTKTGDIDLVRSILGHLDKMKKLEPGVQRALLALVAMEHAFSGLLDGGGHVGGAVFKLIGGDAPRGDEAVRRGDALARLVPGAVVATGIAHLLGSGRPEQPLLPAPPAPSSPPESSDPLHGLQAFADQLLSSL